MLYIGGGEEAEVIVNPIDWIKRQFENSDEDILLGQSRPATLPADVVRWIETHFSAADREHALQMLTEVASVGHPPPSPRLLRSVTFLSRGDIKRLRSAIESMREDWRDVISWAEYEERDGIRIQVRDLNRPLPGD